MKKIHLILMLGAIFTIGDRPPPDPKLKKALEAMAAKITALPVAKAQFFFYSLNPTWTVRDDPDGKAFHRHLILGEVEIKNDKDKSALINALAKGIRESDGVRMKCFNPRHGIRLITGSTTSDLLICFECQTIEGWGFKDGDFFSTAPSPAPVFNDMLDKYKLKRELPPSRNEPNPFE
jgi:hypothetical protein